MFLSCSEIKTIIDSFGSHLNIDLQQRGVEFSQLFGHYGHLRESLLEKMPAMPLNRVNGSNGNGIDGESSMELNNGSEKVPAMVINKNFNNNTDTLLDLLGSGDDIIMTNTSATTSSIPTLNSFSTNVPTQSVNNQDLLDLLGGIDLSTPVMSNNNNNNILTSPVTTTSILDDNENTKIPAFNLNNGAGLGGSFDLTSPIGDGLDFLTSSSTVPTIINPLAKILVAFEKNDLLVQLATVKKRDCFQVIMITVNNSLDTLEQYLFQVSCYLRDL